MSYIARWFSRSNPRERAVGPFRVGRHRVWLTWRKPVARRTFWRVHARALRCESIDGRKCPTQCLLRGSSPHSAQAGSTGMRLRPPPSFLFGEGEVSDAPQLGATNQGRGKTNRSEHCVWFSLGWTRLHVRGGTSLRARSCNGLPVQPETEVDVLCSLNPKVAPIRNKMGTLMKE